jgi:hypothetical protein
MASNNYEYRPVGEPSFATLSIDEGFDDDENDDSEASPTQQVACCGCCCDFRRAVIVLNSITVGFYGLFFLFVAYSYISAMSRNERRRLEIDGEKTLDVALIFFQFSAPAFGAIGIHGAIKFRQLAVAAAANYYAIGVVLCTIHGIVSILAPQESIQLYVDGVPAAPFEGPRGGTSKGIGLFLCAVVYALWLYPHVFMIRLMQNGIMTRTNYPNVSKSCCG